MNELTAFIQHQLYPALFERIPQALPEHAFKKVGADWHSQTYLSADLHPHRSDKCVITAQKPSHILEQGLQALSLVDYVMHRDRTTLLQSVRHLAQLCGLQREFAELAKQDEPIATSVNRTSQARIGKRTETNKNQLNITKPYGGVLKSTDVYTFGRNRKEWEAFGNKWKDLENPAGKPSYFYHNADILPKYADLAQNHFVAYLAQLPGWNRKTAEFSVKQYQVGTAQKGAYAGSPIFWRFSEDGRLSPSKIMRYEKDGKRAKRPPYLTWTNLKADYAPLANPPHFYGLQRLSTDKKQPIALVESEKTAIIASIYLPHFTWIATGGDTYFSGTVNQTAKTRMQPLEGRKVVLFPDLDKMQSWREKAQIWADQGFDVHINSFVSAYQHLVSEKTADLADFFAQINLQEFHQKPAEHVVKRINTNKTNTNIMLITKPINP